MTRTISRAAIVAALLSAASTAAMANGAAPNYGCATAAAATTTCINGGGSSLAANMYAGAIANGNLSNGELTQYAAAAGGSIGFYYETAGSGAGQTALLNNDPSYFGNGDAGKANGTTPAFSVHYGASDSYINGIASSVLNPYIGAGHPMPTGGQFIQIPMFATPIAIPINQSHMGTNGAVTLTDTDLCGIFSGLITNWSKTSVAAHFGAGPINVYWRADNLGSGTTFLLTQHLAAVCTTANTFPGFTFKTNAKFAQLFNGVAGVTITTPPSDGSTLWAIPTGTNGAFSNFHGIKGSSGMAAGILADASKSAMGYVSPDYTAIAATPASAADKKLFVASVLNATNNTAYLPSLTNVNLAITNPGSSLYGTAPALTLAAASNQVAWVPEIAQPSKGYPIVGYTNWLLAQCYKNATVAMSLTGFLAKHIGGTYASLLNSNGFVPVLGSSTTGIGAAINKVFLSNLSGLNMNINNPTACKGVIGR